MKRLTKKSNKLKYCGLALLLLPMAAVARPMLAPAPYHYYLGMNGSASFSKVGDNGPMIVYDGIIRDTYITNSSNSIRPMLGLNAGIEFVPRAGSPTFDIGLAVYTNPSPFSFYGTLNEQAGDDPEELLYGYHFNVVSSRAMAEIQLNWLIGHQFATYIDAGAGLAWNRTKRYKESASDPNYPPLPPFQSNTNTNFAYQLGFGLSFMFNTNEDDPEDFLQDRVSLGYRYTNLGQVSLSGRGPQYPYGGLNTGNMKSNEVTLTYIHLF